MRKKKRLRPATVNGIAERFGLAKATSLFKKGSIQFCQLMVFLFSSTKSAGLVSR